MLLGVSAGAGLLGRWAGLELHQRIAGSVFLATILGTLLFWHLRLSIAFLGVSVLILTRSFDISHFVEFSSLPVILFLAGMMMGNPVGIYIGTQAGLTFQDFLVWAFPIMLLALATTVGVTLFWFRAELREFDARLAERLERNLSLAPRLDAPYKRSLALLFGTFTLIALHHQIEGVLKLDKNSVLLIAPLICAGITMILRQSRARHYVEHEVDWWTLLFFMLLFAVAGTLAHVGLTMRMAQSFTSRFGHEPSALIPAVMATTALGSAFVDNVVFVASGKPICGARRTTRTPPRIEEPGSHELGEVIRRKDKGADRIRTDA